MSSDPVISVENLGKRYRIGVAQKRARNLREALGRAAVAPFGYLRSRLRGANEAEILWALKDVSFEVKQGEVLGIVGRNGAGKSTLLKILSRITDPTEGRALIRGRVNSLLEVGTGFHPELTGRENIYMNAAMHGMRHADITRKLDEIIAFAEIEKFIDTPAKRYSSGMYVRLAFAVAAHLEPDVLIIDEVLAVGDAGFQKKCLGEIGNVARQGRTVLVVSHNMPVISNLCERAILLESGRVQAEGPALEIVKRYISAAGSVAGEIIWPDPARAPGDERLRLHAVRVTQEGTRGPTADVDISREVQIRFAYWCLKEGTSAGVGIWLKDSSGVGVLASANMPSAAMAPDSWYSRPLGRGLYETVCRIPPNFLNDIQYSVSAILAEAPSNRPVVQLDMLLSFQVHDTGEMRREHYGGWLGMVRPRLGWSTEPLGRDVSVIGPSRGDPGLDDGSPTADPS